MKKSWNKLPKWEKIVLWIVGVFLGLVFIIWIILKGYVSTWSNYKGDEFSINYPQDWDIQDPKKDTNDAQFIYDAGSILKIGDKATNFFKGADGTYKYQGNLLIYVYKYSAVPDQTKPLKENIKNYYYPAGGNTYKVSVTYYGGANLIKSIYFNTLGNLIAKSFKILTK